MSRLTVRGGAALCAGCGAAGDERQGEIPVPRVLAATEGGPTRVGEEAVASRSSR